MQPKSIKWNAKAKATNKTADWYAEECGVSVGEHFLHQVYVTLETLQLFPAIGSTRHKYLLPDLDEPLRSFPVSSFERHLIYYVDYSDHVYVIRVWNSAQGFQLFADDDSEHLSS